MGTLKIKKEKRGRDYFLESKNNYRKRGLEKEKIITSPFS